MKRFLCILTALVLLLSGCALADSEFTLPEKLLKQVEAGSGFSADVQLDFTDAVGKSKLQKPIPLNITYIRNEEGTERQAELSLVEGERTLSTLNVNLAGEALAFQADVFSPDWFSLSFGSDPFALDGLLKGLPSAVPAKSGEGEASEAPAVVEPLTVAGLMDMSGVPALCERFLKLAARYRGIDLTPLYDDFTVRLDLWLEGFRTEPLLEKDRRNQSVLKVSYTVPVSALKAELKTLILELPEKEELFALVASPLTEEERKLYLNADYLDYYFAAVDALPLTGDLKIERTLSTLTGETMSLIVSLPLHDDRTGDAALSYERTLGKDDRNTHTFTLTGKDGKLALSFLYSFTEKGQFISSGSVSAQKADGERKLDYVLTLDEESDKNAEGDDRSKFNAKLQLTPSGFPLLGSTPVEINAKLVFTSASAKTAATYVEGNLSLGSAGDTVSLSFSGKTRKKWEMTRLTETPTQLNSLPIPEALSLVTACVGNVNALLGDYLAGK